MTLAAAAFLLLQQDDAAAETLLLAAQARLSSARTVRTVLTISAEGGPEALGTTRLSILLKGADRWRVETEASTDTFGLAASLNLISDGRKVRSLRAGRSPAEALPEPAAGAVRLREALRTSSLLYMFGRDSFTNGEAFGARRTFEKIKDAGTETRDGRKLRAITAALKLGGFMRGESLNFKILVDPEGPRLVRREIVVFRSTLVESFDELAFDEEIPDTEFAFQTLTRLNRARAEQAAAAVDLFTRYAGRLPRALSDLAARPAWLEPDVFFPAAGFVLGAAPADPWNRPYEILEEKGRPVLAGRGADGRPGGKGDAEDVVVPLRAPTGRAVGAPSDRLRRHFESRVRLQLLAAAVRGYAAAYGDLPRKKAALWAKAEDVETWPDGGWIPEGMPADGWGDPFRLISDEDVVRVQVQDPRARRIAAKALTAEERAALDAAARFRLSGEDRAALERLLDGLRDEDFEKREKADDALRAKGPPAVGAIEERMKSEKDTEARARLGIIRKSLRIPPAPWPAELGFLSMSVGRGVRPDEAGLGGIVSLKTLASAQADFRANDRDGNKIQDFWSGDVAGLYTIQSGGEMIKLIELGVAGADAAPLDEGAALDGIVERASKNGYLFRAMTHDGSGGRPEAYHNGTNRNPSKFGFCAYPEEYGVGGTMTAILNESNTIFLKDTGGEPVLEWPSDAELRGWTKAD